MYKCSVFLVVEINNISDFFCYRYRYNLDHCLKSQGHKQGSQYCPLLMTKALAHNDSQGQNLYFLIKIKQCATLCSRVIAMPAGQKQL